MANKIRLARGTKANIEANKSSLLDYEIVYSTDGKEIGVKNSDGTITYFLNKEHTVTPATKTKITYNEQGLVTGGADLAPADLPSGIPQSKISGLGTSLSTKLDKDFSSLTTQPTPTFDDYVVINRATTAQRVTVGNLLALVDTGIFITVSALPTTGVANKIYLVPSDDTETQNVLDEFIWVNNNWEKIGAVKVDLSDYYTITQTDSLLANKLPQEVFTHEGKAETYIRITNIRNDQNTVQAMHIHDSGTITLGGTLGGITSKVKLANDPIDDYDAATKKYADTKLDEDSIIDGGDIS
jgi:hypothetical protein